MRPLFSSRCNIKQIGLANGLSVEVYQTPLLSSLHFHPFLDDMKAVNWCTLSSSQGCSLEHKLRFYLCAEGFVCELRMLALTT